MNSNIVAQKALEGATTAVKAKNYVKALQIIEKGLEILYRNPVMNRNQIAILSKASRDISESKAITFGMRKRAKPKAKSKAKSKPKSKAKFGFGEDLYNYLVYEDRYPVFIIRAEDEKHAQEKILSFAESEAKFARFFNKMRENSIHANPYASALEDKAFLSEKNGVSVQKAQKSRREYLEKYRVGGQLALIE